MYYLFNPCQATTGSGSDRYISCWLCERYGYFKCADLTGRALDAVRVAAKGQRRSCPDRGEKDSDFDTLFTQTKLGLLETKKLLKSVIAKFKQCHEMFEADLRGEGWRSAVFGNQIHIKTHEPNPTNNNKQGDLKHLLTLSQSTILTTAPI
uniref:Uncharacterized protein n=1 Tax=Glossina austeni TaxID=7395 RepID=A0A1A9UIQ9_GLOAU